MKPFERLVRHEGNELLFKCIELSIASTAMGIPLHLHAEGLRGTGKSTIMLAARQVLPNIVRVKGCVYNCDPSSPHCPEHRDLTPSQIQEIGVEEVPMPFLEISHSAKIGTVVGSIDLEKLASSAPRASVLPGTIPMAHRGIVFVDEVNRLAETSPEIADALLSAMGTKPGRVKIEETGMKPIEMAVSCSVWAASNPDEEPGALEDIRKQLSDRFDMVVSMGRPTDPAAVVRILRRDPAVVGLKDEVKARLLAACLRGPAEVPEQLDEVIAQLYVMFNLESIRSAEALRHVSAVHAAIMGKERVDVEDLLDVAGPCLRHRVDLNTLSQILKYLTELKDGRKRAQVPAGGLPSAEAQSQEEAKPSSPLDRLLNRLRESLGTYSGGARSSFKPLDPMKTPVGAPPKVARRIIDLTLGELVRTEEDLK
ncbi:MAG: magnesium chelatase [Bacillota bacterium]